MDDLKPQELVTQLESIAVMELRFHPTVASVLRQSARYIKQSLQSQPTVERAELVTWRVLPMRYGVANPDWKFKIELSK